MTRKMRIQQLLVLLACLSLPVDLVAAEWPHWRGPNRNGVSDETDLIDGWSLDGENLVWRADFVGRSTPVIFDGRACANGRAGEGVDRREIAACFDAVTGEKLWQRDINVYHTTVPWTRVGWANVAGDPETGYLFVQSVGGMFVVYDRDGEVVWERNLVEERGFMEGYGGRTQTPLVDQDKVIVTFANTSWGDQRIPRHRMRAFDKRTGEEIWVSTPGGGLKDKNTQSTPAVAVVDGRRILFQGNGDGGVYAVDANTGERIWGFPLSKRGINTSVSVFGGDAGSTVLATHSEENVDEGTMGRIVAIDAASSGDGSERWRSPIGIGFSSPVIYDGRVYAVDNSANLHALDAISGEELWELNLGRVGKASPVWADGKLYVTTVNGRIVIVGLGDDGGEILDAEVIKIEDQSREAEIYSSIAISDGRLYFTTEEGFYCIGDKDRAVSGSTSTAAAPTGEGPPATILVRPAEIHLRTGTKTRFTAHAFDALGRPLGEIDVSWALDGLDGEMVDGGLKLAADASSHAGKLVATAGELTASARVRAIAPLPLEENFDDVEADAVPDYQHAYPITFKVAELDGERVLSKPPSARNIHRHITFFGTRDMSGYTVQTDAYATRTKRKMPDMGLINSGYKMELLGTHQKLQVRSWTSALRMADDVDFSWEADRWYRLKMRVDHEGGKAIIRGKAWLRGEAEPDDWTITVEDPRPILSGSPGIAAYSPATVYYDNYSVHAN